MTAVDELRNRLRHALRPPNGPNRPTLEESAKEMKAVREACLKTGIDYGKMLTEVCRALSSERKESYRGKP